MSSYKGSEGRGLSPYKGSNVCHPTRALRCVILQRLWGISSYKGSNVCLPTRDLRFVILQGLWGVSSYKGSEVCHPTRALRCVILQGVWDLFMLHMVWCMSYYTTFYSHCIIKWNACFWSEINYCWCMSTEDGTQLLLLMYEQWWQCLLNVSLVLQSSNVTHCHSVALSANSIINILY